MTLQGENTKIIAPMILADSFDVFPEDATDAEIEALTVPNGFNLYGRSAGNLYNFLNISQYGESAVFASPAGGYAYWDFDRTDISGRAYYAGSGQTGANAEVATLGDVPQIIHGTGEYTVTSGLVHVYDNAVKLGATVVACIPRTSNGAYTLTPASNMKIWVTFPKTARQVITENSSYNEVSPFNAPSLTSAFMLQSTGDSETQPMSQAAVTAAVQAVTGANVLTGKKWVACGDSFTHGDFTGLDDPTEYTFQDTPYQGENMVYPFFIGRRTGAVVSNIAVNGMTMAAYSGASAANCFSYSGGAYTNIPEDADYITLYFGINDSHRDIPIGTLTDTVNTTFYGAWNTVMEYLITNYPNAKIGIIISNGCESTAYPNAEIEIAKRWGVAYFDMNLRD